MADQDTKYRVTFPIPGGEKTIAASMGGERNPTPEKLKALLRAVHETFRNLSEADFAKVTVEEVGQVTPADIERRAVALAGGLPVVSG